VQAATEMGQQAVLTAFVSARDPQPTLMVRWGDWVGRAGVLFLLGLGLVAAWRAWGARAPSRIDDVVVFDVVVLSPMWRALTAALRTCAALGLLWLAFDMSQRIGWQVASLSQLWWFAGAVLAPAVAAWAIGRAFKAQMQMKGGTLVLEQRSQRIEISAASITALTPWRVPLPHSGIALVLSSGKRWAQGLVLNRPASLRRALMAAGAPLALEDSSSARWSGLVEQRAAALRPRLDHAALKFGLFPLLPALVAFRLHQVIAFGGTFGEWLTYGPGAWFAGLAIWWGAWSLGLMLFAAGLRVLIEVISALAVVLKPTKSAETRDALEWLGRLTFYIGVPVWLALRLFSSQ